jgi:hypothetical protein
MSKTVRNTLLPLQYDFSAGGLLDDSTVKCRQACPDVEFNPTFFLYLFALPVFIEAS